jgi:Protein of unknown function (DUF4199)
MDRKISRKYGLIAGGSVVLYFLLFYFLDKESMLKMWVAASSMFVYVLFMAKAVGDQRKLQEDIISFKEAISVAFLTLIIANIVYYIFYFFIIKSDPELVVILKQNYIDFYQKVLSNQDPVEVEKSFEDFEVNLSFVLLRFAQGAILGFILSVIIAGMMRRGKRRKE